MKLVGLEKMERYRPNTKEAYDLFASACEYLELPLVWATSTGLHKILAKESRGYVGIVNYTYGDRAQPAHWEAVHRELKNGRKTARSSATGLGQLILANVDCYYPSGRRGIGRAFEEACGMLAYIKDRYGSPDRAWKRYGTAHEGY